MFMLEFKPQINIPPTMNMGTMFQKYHFDGEYLVNKLLNENEEAHGYIQFTVSNPGPVRVWIGATSELNTEFFRVYLSTGPNERTGMFGELTGDKPITMFETTAGVGTYYLHFVYNKSGTYSREREKGRILKIELPIQGVSNLTTSANVNGAWLTSKAEHVNVNGSWVRARQKHINVNGSWVTNTTGKQINVPIKGLEFIRERLESSPGSTRLGQGIAQIFSGGTGIKGDCVMRSDIMIDIPPQGRIEVDIRHFATDINNNGPYQKDGQRGSVFLSKYPVFSFNEPDNLKIYDAMEPMSSYEWRGYQKSVYSGGQYYLYIALINEDFMYNTEIMVSNIILNGKKIF